MFYCIGIALALIFCLYYKAFAGEAPANKWYMLALVSLWWPVIPAALLIDFVVNRSTKVEL